MTGPLSCRSNIASTCALPSFTTSSPHGSFMVFIPGPPIHAVPGRLMRWSSCRSSAILLLRDVGDQALLEGDLLGLTWALADVHDEAVDLQHPDQRVVVHPAGQCPTVIELADPQHRADRLRLP